MLLIFPSLLLLCLFFFILPWPCQWLWQNCLWVGRGISINSQEKNCLQLFWLSGLLYGWTPYLKGSEVSLLLWVNKVVYFANIVCFFGGKYSDILDFFDKYCVIWGKYGGVFGKLCGIFFYTGVPIFKSPPGHNPALSKFHWFAIHPFTSLNKKKVVIFLGI